MVVAGLSGKVEYNKYYEDYGNILQFPILEDMFEQLRTHMMKKNNRKTQANR